MRLVALAAFLVLQGCASLGGGPVCDAPRSASSPPSAGATLSVISWNVHGLPFDASLERRLDSIAGEIRGRRPDLVLLQEAWLEADAARLSCALNADYERVPDGAGVRAGVLSLFGHRRGGLLALVRRDSAWQREPLAPRFEEFAAAAPWYRLEELDGIAGKGVQSFAIGDGARRVVVLNTHLQAQYPSRGNVYQAERGRQIEQVLAHAASAIHGDVLLVAGDFNTREDESAHYAALSGALDDLTAPYRRKCACGTYISRESTESGWIDYVFARRARGGPIHAQVERIRNHKRDDPYSDHHGLWLELDLAR